ncbi:hypothetical protein GCM10023087_22350 [Microbacterium rhizosphaerae]
MDATHGADWSDPVLSSPINELTEPADPHSGHVAHEVTAASGGHTVPEHPTAAEHRVTWVRVSDLLESGTGLMAGRGIDFEAELARRVRHPVEVSRRAIRDRSSSLPPLSAFGRRRPNQARESISRR